MRVVPGVAPVVLVLTVLSVILAVVPQVAFLLAVWMLDRYAREPVWLFGLTFLWGAVGAIVFAYFGSLITMVLASPLEAAWPGISPLLGPVVIAPLIEEPGKAMFLLFVLWNRQFDTVTDGFVYGAAAGLGFGMTENLKYFTEVGASGDLSTWALTVLIRTFYSAVMHAAATAMVGAAVALGRFRGCLGLVAYLAAGLALGMGLHAAWNGLLTAEEVLGTGNALFTILLFALPVVVLLMFLAFQACLWWEGLVIRRELEDEADLGLIPRDHPARLASFVLRHSRAWVPAGVDHRRYVQLATTLAFRKRNARLAVGSTGEFYRDEVFRLRRQLRKLLGTLET